MPRLPVVDVDVPPVPGRTEQPQRTRAHLDLIVLSPNTMFGVTPRTKEHIFRYNEAKVRQEECLANQMKDGMCFEVVYSTCIECMINLKNTW